ncbi:MAG TPA: DUF4229 domain-containing protein [Aeromicrobium sp.]|nr:DUF4229 domain-containing protein [Aeromicrobium sp.]
MKAVWKYTLARLALFLVTYVALWAVANAQWKVALVNPFVLIGAFIVSGVISLFVLRELRDDMVRHFELRAAHRVARAELTRSPDELD